MSQVMDMISNALADYARRTELEDLADLREQVKNNNAEMTVIKFKMDLQEQQLVNNIIGEKIEDVNSEAQSVYNELNLALQTDKPLKPADIVKLLRTMNNQMSMMRKRMTQHERDRL